MATAASIKAKLDKKGRAVRVIQKSRTLVDGERPWKGTTGAGVDFSTICVFIDYESKEIDGDKIKAGDKKLLANAVDNGDIPFEDYDEIIDGGVTWRIKRVETLQPGDEILMYTVQIRK